LLRRPVAWRAGVKIRVTARENALSRRGQRIHQIRGGELKMFENGGEGCAEKTEAFLLRNQHESFAHPQNCDGSAGIETQFVTALLGNSELSLLAGRWHLTPGRNILPGGEGGGARRG
jgi:hypothetical protein